MTGQDVVNRAQVLLNDSGNTLAQVTANTRWPVSELLLWITDAQREAVIVSPNANNVIMQVPLVAGTRQTISASNPEAWVLLSIRRNLTYNSTTQIYSGARAVRQTPQAILDAYDPNWHTDTPSPTVWNYTYDLQDRKAFYVYPPNDGTGYLECNIAKTPGVVSDLTTTLELDDVYLGALASYVCFRALMKDAEYSGGASLAQTFYGQFYNSMTAQNTSEQSDSANNAFATPAPKAPVMVPPSTVKK